MIIFLRNQVLKRFRIEDNCIIKFLIVLAVICIHNDTRCDGRLSGPILKHVNYITRPEHWEDMWFEKVRTSETHWEKKIEISIDNSLRPLNKLKLIPYMMGCGYGQILNNYLRLMVHTVDECNRISPKFVADDCWSKLQTSVTTGTSVLSFLLGVFGLLQSFDSSVFLSLFYEPMARIQLFLKVDRFNWPIMTSADFLETLLFSQCHPSHSVVDTDVLKAEYRNLNTMINLYDYYVNTLNSYTGQINEHLRLLGFQYDATTELTTYTTPNLNGQ